MLDRCTLIRIAPTSTPEITFPITSGGPIFGVFVQLLLIINVKEWYYRINYAAQFCCPFNCECTDRFLMELEFEQVFRKKLLFSFVQPKKLLSVSANCGQNLENDLNRGQPLAKFSTEQTIWYVCRLFRFLGYLVQK